MVDDLAVVIKEQNGHARHKELVRINVPFQSGALTENCILKYLDEGELTGVVGCKPLAYWPDNSVKWAECRFFVTCLPYEQKTLKFRVAAEAEHETTEVQDDVASLALFPTTFNAQAITMTLVTDDGTRHPVEVCSVTAETLFRQADQSVIKRTVQGKLLNLAHIKFTLVQEYHQLLRVIRSDITIHNANRARHPNGQWDLGDENSLLFKSLMLQVDNDSDTVNFCDVEQQNWSTFNTPFSLIQHSSGGENWNSPNHVDASNKVPFNTKGFVLTHSQDTHIGERISPLISAVGENPLTCFIEHFWQNFPSGLQHSGRALTIELFPLLDYHHELQPGEKKTQSVWLSNNPDTSVLKNLLQPLHTRVCTQYLAAVNVIPFYTPTLSKSYQDIIELALDEKNGFAAKRELIDEYGWRNFGDLYADHENAEFNGQGLIISHYNNQYDPLYGFIRQYLHSGEQQWLALANELAQHIVDIDIYHTDLDRCEYNNGLFWHTDHYVDAATASHRTYSKNQPQNVYMDHAGGGGPAGQHCYTTGLMLHHFLTGSDSSKQAVIKLTEFITHYYEGTGGLLDFALAVKNRQRPDTKDVVTGHYPLDRGTGHYIVALIDAFEVTGHQSYLDRASLVIKHTVAPFEDLALRNLDNVEETWFYTVFLQGVGRYLWVKHNNTQFDESYDYALQVLTLFTDWMLQHEQPYLTKPEILEFPNQTWTAQDMRKVNVLAMAGMFRPQGQAFTEKAQALYQYVVEQLKDDPNRDYCRILCILMQNEGVLQYCSERDYAPKTLVGEAEMMASVAPTLMRQVGQRLSDTTLKKELDWLTRRVEKVEKMFANKELQS